MYFPQLDVTSLVVHDLPPLSGTQLYEGWLIENGQPESIGPLNVQDDTATLNFPGDVRSYDSVAISREPGPQPSQKVPAGQVVAMGQLLRPQ